MKMKDEKNIYKEIISNLNLQEQEKLRIFLRRIESKRVSDIVSGNLYIDYKTEEQDILEYVFNKLHLAHSNFQTDISKSVLLTIDDVDILIPLSDYLEKETTETLNEKKIKNKNVKKIKLSKNILSINDFEIVFSEDKGRASLLKMLFAKKKRINIDEYADNNKGELTLTDKYKNGFYKRCQFINERIELKIGVTDFLIYSTNYAEINPIFINYIK